MTPSLLPIPPLSVGAIILNGGTSRRMGGQPKALVQVGGKPLLERLGHQLQTAGYDPIFVVVGAHADAVSDLLIQLPFLRPVRNESWSEGMASSIRVGLAAAAAAAEPLSAVLVTPIDLPFAQTEDWVALRRQYLDTSGIVATATQPEGYPGAPAIFPRSTWSELSTLTGDRGARDWLRAQPQPPSCVNCPSLSRDADTPDSWPVEDFPRE